MKKTMLAVAGAAFLITGLWSFSSSTESDIPKDPKKRLQQLSGTYADPVGVPWGRGVYGKRTFHFSKGQWKLQFTLASDSLLQQKIFSFRTFGTYEVQKPSTIVEGAYETLFRESRKYVTLHTTNQQVAGQMGLLACGLEPGIEKDISLTGCSLWKPVSICGQDHDLLAMDDKGQLFFGRRPMDNDMCTPDKRPTELYLPVTLVK